MEKLTVILFCCLLLAGCGTKSSETLAPMEATLREGCIGQLPEIYDGDAPAFSRGCFAQAWSVGEMLRVYEALEAIENRCEA